MGQVWEAWDQTLDRPVAVKLISLLAGGGSRSEEARARFLREARITAQLQHAHIVTIHDLGQTGPEGDQVPFLVMELVRGEGLDAKLRQGAVALRDVARWGTQIADALADAHGAGIMHRDIKPSNILVTPGGAVKVLDFGIARAADPYATADRLTQTGFIVGTPPYMAPEQARGHPEPRSDLYALGCVLFELITGQLPFQAPDTVGYLSAHLTQEPPAPSSVSPDIPSAWDDLVLNLLRKDPDHRYAHATDLAQALHQLARASEPATSPRTSVSASGTSDRGPKRAVAFSNANAVARPHGRGHVLTKLERYVPSASLLIVVGVLAVFSLSKDHSDEGATTWDASLALAIYVLLFAFVLVLATALTPSSRTRTRAAGYAATVLLFFAGVYSSLPKMLVGGSGGSAPAITALSFAVYCYRDIRTRRARLANANQTALKL
ncbi:protein kinase [Streptomyces sp. NPDC048441]|uniref:serine/threonine-protein kinase n=1 Tax=Streptomyces sp. NPDC048441 TaxID=3365552 RepID=UPI00371BD62A